MAQFEGFDEATPQERGPKLLPGIYEEVEVAGFFHMEKSTNPKHKNEEVFGFKFLVIRSSVPERPPGMQIGATFTEGSFGKGNFWGQVKPLLAVIVGKPAEELRVADIQECLKPENPFRGRRFRLEAQRMNPEKEWVTPKLSPVIPADREPKLLAARAQVIHALPEPIDENEA